MERLCRSRDIYCSPKLFIVKLRFCDFVDIFLNPAKMQVPEYEQAGPRKTYFSPYADNGG